MAQFPVINGNYFSWSDIEATFTTATGQPFQMAGFKAINYKDSLSKQKVRGTAAVPIGVTKGKYDASGDIELFLPQANLMIATMGPGWRQVPGSFQVSYISSGPLGAPVNALPQSVITDSFTAFLTELAADQTEGDEALTRKFTLFIPGQILWNGIASIIEPSLQTAIA